MPKNLYVIITIFIVINTVSRSYYPELYHSEMHCMTSFCSSYHTLAIIYSCVAQHLQIHRHQVAN